MICPKNESCRAVPDIILHTDTGTISQAKKIVQVFSRRQTPPFLTLKTNQIKSINTSFSMDKSIGYAELRSWLMRVVVALLLIPASAYAQGGTDI